MKRRGVYFKKRPAHWPETAEVGRHETGFGFMDIEEKGRELTSKTLPHGPKPVEMRAKAKYRAS